MSVSSVSSRVIGKITNNKLMKKGCEYFKNNKEKAIAYATLTSLVGKDGVGCYLYVTQSLNNKKIPDDKRQFVAAMDLTNGILMMLSQVAFFFAMRKFSKPLFEKLFKKSFGSEAFKNLVTKLRNLIKKEGKTPPRKPELKREHNELKDVCFAAFENVVNIVAATILAKRVFVPFVSTPLAQYITNKRDEKVAKKNGVQQQPSQESPKSSNITFAQMNKDKFLK